MTISNFIKSVQDIMRMDAGVDGDAQRISQLTWLLFLKIFDTKEQEEWSFEDQYSKNGPFLPKEYQWNSWAGVRKADRMNSDKLMEFIEELFRALKSLEVDERTDKRKVLLRDVFEDSNNYMKSGVLVWQVIDKINEIDFGDYAERHAFNDIYESILRDLQSAGNSGEYYTPRPVTDFIVNRLNPQVGHKIADFACGTGGFLISALNHIRDNNKNISPNDNEIVKQSLFGIEKKPMPHLLCCTNMILHDIDFPNILHRNSLSTSIRDYPEADKFEIIAMNPPFGGTEEEGIKMNFPAELRTSETADLFLALIMYRLKRDGKAGVVLPQNFFFENDNVKVTIKEKLFTDFNVHTIIRLPKGVFEPYTDIETNLVFFDRKGTTEKIWYYELPLPEEYKKYSKTRPLQYNELETIYAWWDDRKENQHAWIVTPDDIRKNNYNMDFKNPNSVTDSFSMTMEQAMEKTRSVNDVIDKRNKSTLNKFTELFRLSEKDIDGTEIKIKDVLKRKKETMVIDDETEYSRVTIRTKHLGIHRRDVVLGEKIGTKKQFYVRKNQFLLSKIDARHGAFGIVPDELDGAIITGNFWTYEVDFDKINIEWFNIYTSTEKFMWMIHESSSGTTNRKYLDEKKFLNYKLTIPSLEIQNKIVDAYNKITDNLNILKEQMDNYDLILARIKESFIE